MRIDETVAGKIEVNFSLQYLTEQGYPLQRVFSDLSATKTLIDTSLMYVGYSEDTIAGLPLLVDAAVYPGRVQFNIYTPHDFSKHPYILNGEDVVLPPEPYGFIVVPDDYLGGVCECGGCEHARRTLGITGTVPFGTNLDTSNGEYIEALQHEYDPDDEIYNDEDFETEAEYLEAISYTKEQRETIRNVFGKDFDEMTEDELREAVALIYHGRVDLEEVNYEFEVPEGTIREKPLRMEPQTLVPPTNIGVIVPLSFIYTYRDLEDVLKLARILQSRVDDHTSLYSFEKKFYMVHDFTNDRIDADDIGKSLDAIHSEHGGVRSKRTTFFLNEYGNVVIADYALSTLLSHFA